MATKKIIHLSDLHIGKTSDMAKYTLRIFSHIGNNFPKIPVLITGDLTDSGTKMQVNTMKTLLDMLGSSNPVLTVPGNHDYNFIGNIWYPKSRERWTQHLSKPRGWGNGIDTTKWIGGANSPKENLGILEWKNLSFFGLDSGDPNDEVITARGIIKQSLSTFLKNELGKDQYNNKKRIVILHHHPFMRQFVMELKGAKKLMNALSGKCDLLLFGHKHRFGKWHDKKDIPLTVASDKTTKRPYKDFFMFNLIEIPDQGYPTHTLVPIQND